MPAARRFWQRSATGGRVFTVGGDVAAECRGEFERPAEFGIGEPVTPLEAGKIFSEGLPGATISRRRAPVVAANVVTRRWKVQSQADLPAARACPSSKVARAVALRAGQHIAMSVVVPPTSAAWKRVKWVSGASVPWDGGQMGAWGR